MALKRNSLTQIRAGMSPTLKMWCAFDAPDPVKRSAKMDNQAGGGFKSTTKRETADIL
jgi:hypothetical protein